MNENLKEMLASAPGTPETSEAAPQGTPGAPQEVSTMLEDICSFSRGLSGDVKVVNHKNTWSIKMKNRNFVFLTKTKKVPLKIQVKNGTTWATVDPASGFEAVKVSIQTAFDSL